MYPIEKMTKILKVSRSSYYQFLLGKASQRERDNQELLVKIKQVHLEKRKIYGSPRIYEELRKQGIKCSRPRVARIMRKAQIAGKMKKPWKKTTKVDKSALTVPNLVKQQFQVEEPNKIWVSDITYIPTDEGWLYVSVSLDLFSRKVVGLCMDQTLHTSLVLRTLGQAFMRRTPDAGLMHHSDKGCQYTSEDFKILMGQQNVVLSMSGTGHCYDNAVAESFFHSLKTEHVNFCR
jgi:transposase InsO family protein